MTPEALRHYLVIRQFDEDVVQDVIVNFLTSTVPIRHPKAWGWKAAQRYAAAQRRRESRQTPCEGLWSPTLVDERTLNPAQRAEVRDELAKVLAHGLPQRKRGRPRNGGFEGWREDYEALMQREPQ